MRPIQRLAFLGAIMGINKLNKGLSLANKVRRRHNHLEFLSRCKSDQYDLVIIQYFWAEFLFSNIHYLVRPLVRVPAKFKALSSRSNVFPIGIPEVNINRQLVSLNSLRYFYGGHVSNDVIMLLKETIPWHDIRLFTAL